MMAAAHARGAGAQPMLAAAERAWLPRLGALMIRPLLPGDIGAYRAFGARLARDDLRLRFAGLVKLDDPAFCARLLDIDHDRVEVLAAFDAAGAMLGVARLSRTAPVEAEAALIVRSDLKRRGLGRLLLDRLARDAADRGIDTLSAQVLHENYPMLRLAVAAGFHPVATSGLLVELRGALPQGCDFDL